MPGIDDLSSAEQADLRDSCTVFLGGHGPVTAAGMLASIPQDTVPDRYGSGGVVAELEAEVAGLLGKPAAVFLPSGTMAQQAVLRVHADRRHRRTIVFHPMCHLDRHEGQAFQRLHGLACRRAGDPASLMTVMTGGEIQPLYHLVRNHRNVDRKSVMYFVSPDADREIEPFVVNDYNRTTNIQELVLNNPEAYFGLAKDFV